MSVAVPPVASQLLSGVGWAHREIANNADLRNTVGPMHLNYVVAPAPIGGLEEVVAALARGMSARHHSVRILALLGPDGSCRSFDLLPAQGVEVVEFRHPARSYSAEVRSLVDAFGPRGGAVAHTHGYHADLVGWRAARIAGSPVLSTVHGFTYGSWKNRVYEWVDRRILARCDAVIAVSSPLARRLSASGVGPSRLHTIPNAYAPAAALPGRDEARRILGIAPGLPLVGWIGRLSEEKGPDVFLEALALAPAWRASVIGSGPMDADLKARAQAAGIDERVQWHGTVPNAGRLLAAFDALVLSSRTEGTPMVLLEGMASQVPLVVTAVGGVPDVVSDGEAILVPSEQPGRIAQALDDIVSHPEAAVQRAAAGLTRQRTAFALEPWLDRYESVYRTLAGSKEPTS